MTKQEIEEMACSALIGLAMALDLDVQRHRREMWELRAHQRMLWSMRWREHVEWLRVGRYEGESQVERHQRIYRQFFHLDIRGAGLVDAEYQEAL